MTEIKNEQWLSIITNPEVVDKIKEFMNNEDVLGIMLWGSRATGFGEPDSDWDALVLITNEYYNKLEVKETAFVLMDENKDPKKVFIDFSLWSEECAHQVWKSPKDIDHWAWVEGKVIYDPQGKMAEWKEKISRYPEEEHEERLKTKFVDLIVSRYYAMITDKRGYKPDSKLNSYRAVITAIHLW
ncbi:MAG: nucleotidyltransferase domain-containing protein, partial [Candidatus Hodarchaeales archaeon]